MDRWQVEKEHEEQGGEEVKSLFHGVQSLLFLTFSATAYTQHRKTFGLPSTFLKNLRSSPHKGKQKCAESQIDLHFLAFHRTFAGETKNRHGIS
jgi:hypothetical protein